MRFIMVLCAALALGWAQPAAAQKGPENYTAASPITPEFMLGRWADNSDTACVRDIVYYDDGTFVSYVGGGGQWSLQGDVMTMSGPGGVFPVRLGLIDQNNVTVTNPDGTTGRSHRCAPRMDEENLSGRSDLLVGRWADNTDTACNNYVIYNSDGTFVTFNGGRGRWTLNGDRLTVAGNAAIIEQTIRWAGRDHLIVTNADRSVGTSHRCS